MTHWVIFWRRTALSLDHRVHDKVKQPILSLEHKNVSLVPALHLVTFIDGALVVSAVSRIKIRDYKHVVNMSLNLKSCYFLIWMSVLGFILPLCQQI